MARTKISWLLILQGWAMLWVVIGHSPLKMDDSMPAFAKVLYDFAYSFHMPLFILISGYLFYMIRLLPSMKNDMGEAKWRYKSIMIDKLKRLGVPFAVFTIIAMFLKVLFPGDMARQASFTIQEFVHAILYPREGPLLEMWFVAVIMWMFVLTPLWQVCFRSKLFQVIMLIILFLLHVGSDYFHLGSFLSLKDTARCAIYFYIGMIACMYGFDSRYKSYRYILMALSSVLYLSFRYIDFSFGTAISGIVFSVGLAFVLDMCIPKVFSSFRNYTYQIFLVSIFAQILVKMIYKRVELMSVFSTHSMSLYVLFFLLCLMMGLYVPVIISKIAERFNWNPILLCLGLKN